MHACVTHIHTCDVTEPTLSHCLFDACVRHHVHLYTYVIYPNMMSHQYSVLWDDTYLYTSWTYVIERSMTLLHIYSISNSCTCTHARAYVCVCAYTDIENVRDTNRDTMWRWHIAPQNVVCYLGFPLHMHACMDMLQVHMPWLIFNLNKNHRYVIDPISLSLSLSLSLSPSPYFKVLVKFNIYIYIYWVV